MIFVVIRDDSTYDDLDRDPVFASTIKEVAVDMMQKLIAKETEQHKIFESYQNTLSKWKQLNPYPTRKTYSITFPVGNPKPTDYDMAVNDFYQRESAVRDKWYVDNNIPKDFVITSYTARFELMEVPSELNIFM
jgi:hypothetical protein